MPVKMEGLNKSRVLEPNTQVVKFQFKILIILRMSNFWLMKKRQSIDANSGMTEMPELSDKDFKEL